MQPEGPCWLLQDRTPLAPLAEQPVLAGGAGLGQPLALLMFVFSAPQGVFLFSLIKYTPLKYNNSYEYPPWGYMLGWLMALSSMVCIPLYAIFILLKTKGPLKQVLGLWSRACCCCSPGGSGWAQEEVQHISPLKGKGW